MSEEPLRMAFATSDGETVNQHFGSTRGLLVCLVGATSVTRLALQEFSKEKKDGNEDKLRARVDSLTDCCVVYCGQVGHSATRQLLARGVQPVTVKGGPEIDDLIEGVQAQLAGEVTDSWLGRVLKRSRSNDSRLGAESLDEEWVE